MTRVLAVLGACDAGVPVASQPSAECVVVEPVHGSLVMQDTATAVIHVAGTASRSGTLAAFAQLDQLVLSTSPTSATSELIQGTFPGAYDGQYVPGAWNQTAGDRMVYREAIAPYCRSCHVSQSTLQLTTPDQVRAHAASLAQMICGGLRSMPSAQATAIQFFRSNA